MTCDQFRHALQALTEWDRPRDEMPAALRQHAESCASCADRWDRVGRLDAALAAIGQRTSAETPSARVEQHLRQAFRAHRAGSAVSGRSRPGVPAWMPAAAAVLVVGIGLSGWWVLRMVRPAASQTAASAVPGGAAGITPRLSAGEHVSGTSDRQAGLGEADATPAGGDDLLDDFVPLPYAALPADGPVHIVQVDLPRSALYDFGVSSQGAGSSGDVITADILVSADGAPRAFRLVDNTAAVSAVAERPVSYSSRSIRP